MPSLAQISQAIADYREGRLSIDAFDDWFHENSRGMFGENETVQAALLAIDSAFSSIRFDEATEEEFQRELANAIRPFEEEKPISFRFPCRPASGWDGVDRLPQRGNFQSAASNESPLSINARRTVTRVA
jgi:hypothetical protein